MFSMNKTKYIHTKRKSDSSKYTIEYYTRVIKHKNISLETLPLHEPIHKRPCGWDCNKTYLHFNLFNYLKTKIEQNWDDIYSDLIKKTRPRYRYLLDKELDWFIQKPKYYINEVPYGKRYSYHDNIMSGVFYNDKEGYLRYFDTKEDLLFYAKNKLRENKLKRLFDETIFDDIDNEFDYIKLIFASNGETCY